MSTVNIILASYNGAEYITEQIRSILAQNNRDWKLYIYDDCSEDDTEQIVRGFMAENPDRIFFKRNETNLGSTRNFLNGVLDSPAADYYMFCDQDDLWLKDKISLSLKLMHKLEKRYGKDKPALVYTDAIIVDKGLNYINNSFIRTDRLKPKRTDISHLLMENKCLGCTELFNAALMHKITIPRDGIRYHDWWVALIASSYGHIRYLHIPTLLYRQHGNNQVGQEKFKTYIKRRSRDTSDIARRLNETFVQAEVFDRSYGPTLKKHKRKIIHVFAQLRNKGFFTRRVLVFRYRFLKSGVLRNIGLMFYL